MSVVKGATELKETLDSTIATMTRDDFNTIMNDAIAVQPEI